MNEILERLEDVIDKLEEGIREELKRAQRKALHHFPNSLERMHFSGRVEAFMICLKRIAETSVLDVCQGQFETMLVEQLPHCYHCSSTARFLAKTNDGYWANLCSVHMKSHGIRIGLGWGTRLVVKPKGEDE